MDHPADSSITFSASKVEDLGNNDQESCAVNGRDQEDHSQIIINASPINYNGTWPSSMSKEEKMIWDELEEEIEQGLEEEIKDEIYRHALKLSRVYQHKKERLLHKDKANSGDLMMMMPTHLEIKICLNNGGTKVEIKRDVSSVDETTTTTSSAKDPPRARCGRRVIAPRRILKSKLTCFNRGRVNGISVAKRVDWSKTLRSESPSTSMGVQLTKKIARPTRLPPWNP